MLGRLRRPGAGGAGCHRRRYPGHPVDQRRGLGGQLVFTTERSFNAEAFVFNAEYPLQLNFVAKDYKADDTGLEYIGRSNQQMGDGGLITQFTDVATEATDRSNPSLTES